jgi:hypothetical protein
MRNGLLVAFRIGSGSYPEHNLGVESLLSKAKGENKANNEQYE